MDGIFDDMDGGTDKVAVAFVTVFAIVFVTFAVAILLAVVRGLRQWSRNNRLPLVTDPAVVIAKRNHRTSGTENSSASTSYYVTFEIRGGERLEFPMLGNQFGTLVEGDRGQLTHQGTRFKGFDRTPQDR
jgi:hypothetical protein